MQYPLDLRFKIFAFAPQIIVKDAAGEVVCYVKQKMFRLKEAVTVFSDQSQAQKLCEIKADRIIDFSASYHFYDSSGEAFGAVRRKGMKSLWKANYEILDESDAHYATLTEMNPMAKVMDGLLGQIPVLGLFCGLFFQPKYGLIGSNGKSVFQVSKERSFLESSFRLEKFDQEADEVDELRALMAVLMMVLLERKRG